jgi:hypothetical protein
VSGRGAALAPCAPVTDAADYHGLAKESIPSLTNPYSERGFGYLDYLEQTSYGISLTSPSWIRKQVQRVRRLEEVYFRDRGWDDHQDVYGLLKQD